MTPWLLVAGDLTPLGGMDAANHALAKYLGGRGFDVHLVTHRAWPDLAALPAVTVHHVWRPFNRHLLGSPLLSRAGLRLWRQLGGVEGPSLRFDVTAPGQRALRPLRRRSAGLWCVRRV